MTTLYFSFAIVGTIILVIQIIASMTGADHDVGHDIHVDLDHGSADFGHISFRTVVAFIAFFGIGGMAAHRGGLGGGMTLGVAIGLGFLAFYGVAFVMMKFHQLRSSGTVMIENTVGRSGRVYLSVPGSMSGSGKVTVTVQGRSMEFPAVTRGAVLPTATTCRVVGLHGKDTVEVESDNEVPVPTA